MVEEILAYDLRQKYAEIVGLHLETVTRARIDKDYPLYFQALEDLFTVIKHKFKTKKLLIMKKESTTRLILKKRALIKRKNIQT